MEKCLIDSIKRTAPALASGPGPLDFLVYVVHTAKSDDRSKIRMRNCWPHESYRFSSRVCIE